MNKTQIGVITIGQSPRVDLREDIKYILDDEFRIEEKGALDEFDLEYVKQNLKPSEEDTVLVSRMRDGEEVILAEEKIIPLIQQCIFDLEERGCKIIIILCTGKFPEFKHKEVLIYPQKLIHKLTEVLIEDGILGIVIPNKDQVDKIKMLWDSKSIKTKIVVASPYLSIERLKESCTELQDTSLILMDCMGYSGEMRNIVSDVTDKLIILPRNLVFAIVNQLAHM